MGTMNAKFIPLEEIKCVACGRHTFSFSVLGPMCYQHHVESMLQAIEINNRSPFGGRYRVRLESVNPLRVIAVED
jgi:hypothetical protein